jgi:hypothetical protein
MPAIAVMFAASTRNGYTAGEGKSVSSQRLDGRTAVVAPKAGNPLSSKPRVELTLRG